MKVKGKLDMQANEITAVRVERLTADPTGGDLYEGRIWLNTTSDIFKIYLNAAVEEIGTGAVTDALQTELDDTQAGAGLGTNGAFTPPGGSTFLGTSTDIVDSLGLLDTEVADNQTAIGNEITNRTNADTAIQDELDLTQAGAGLNIGGTWSGPASNYISGSSSIKNALVILDGQLFTNTGAISQNAIDIGDEETARINADALKVNLAGGQTMLGHLTMQAGSKFVQSTAPTAVNDLVNKAYADSIAAGFTPKDSCRAGTVSPLPTNTYSGAGKTLTCDTAFAIPPADTDTIVMLTSDRLLVKDEATASNNGIYDVTNPGVDPITGVAEVSGVDSTGINVAALTQGDYFILWSALDAVEYYYWIDIDAAGTGAPSGTGTNIVVSVTTGQTDQQVSDAIVTSVNGTDGGTPFSAANGSGTTQLVTVSNLQTGATTDVSDGVATTGFAFTTPQPGVTAVAGTAWILTRSADFNGDPTTEIKGGANTYVQIGSTLAGGGFAVIWDGEVDLDTDPINWSQVSGAGAFSGIQSELDATQLGAGLTVDGAYIQVGGANYINSATSLHGATLALDTEAGSSRTQLDINTTNIGSLTTLADTHETAVGLAANGQFVAYSGTNYLDGSTDIAGAIDNLDNALGNYAEDTGVYSAKTYLFTAGSASTSHIITHNLGRNYPTITVYDSADDNVIIPESIVMDSNNQVTVNFTSAVQPVVRIVA